MTRSARCVALALLSLAAACQARAPRPLVPLAPPRSEAISRFRISADEHGGSAVDLIAADTGERLVPGTAHAEREALLFDDVVRSVEAQFPLVLAALEEVEIAAGELQSAQGGFDTRLKAGGEFGVDGFYENERVKVSIEQPTAAWGATFFGGYKLGTGDFPIWEGGYKTRAGGEFAAGVRVPLLAGRQVDERRTNLWRARLAQEQADPFVLRKRLEATLKAALAYWKWVAAGQKFEIAQRLLALAENRQAGVVLAVDEGELPQIALIENQRLIVERQSILINAERSLQQTAIELSLYWRDAEGNPRLPGPERLPVEMPVPRDPALTIKEGDAQFALAQRPEVRELELEVTRLRLELEQAENSLLPRLDLGVAGSKDTGDTVSDPDDKGPFEFDAFVTFDLPLQRRSAKGKTRTVAAKKAKLERELQLVRDRVVADVRDAASALNQTWLRLAQVRENVRLAGALEQAERLRFQEGESDLLRVNLREQQTASAASMLVDVLAEHFRSLADYRASLGLPYDELIAVRPDDLTRSPR